MNNVLLISIDSLRYDVLSSKLTPNVWRFAKRGTLFDCTIVQAPFTLPSHASMLTGLYPYRHGVRRMVGDRLADSAETILQRLQSAGYYVEALQDFPLFGQRHRFVAGFNPAPRSTQARYVNQAIRQAGNQPFCLFLHYWDVHTPYLMTLPPRGASDLWWNAIGTLRLNRTIKLRPGQAAWLRRTAMIRQQMRRGNREQVWRGYLASIRQMDRWFGRILRLLKWRGVLENTLIVVTSDHGEAFDEHDESHRVPDYYEHGLFLYDNALRVPTLFVGADVPPMTRSSRPIESVDIVPTILQQLGLSANGLDGRVCTVTGEYAPKRCYSETRHRSVDRSALRGTRFKLMHDWKTDESCLIDLQADPGEQQNVSAMYPDVYKELFAQLNARRQQEANGTSLMSSADDQLVQAQMRRLGYID